MPKNHWIRRLGPWITILAVMVAGWSVRAIGLRHGEPEWVYHPDVAKQTLTARHVYHGEENPHIAWGDDRYQESLYPYGCSVWLGRIYRWRDAREEGAPADQIHRYHWALRLRTFNAVVFMLAVGASMVLLRRHLSLSGLLGLGLLVVLEPVTSQHSHYAMGDAPMVGLMVLAWALAWRMAGEPRHLPWASLLAGLTAGTACGVKYQGLLALVFPGLTWLVMLFRGRCAMRAIASAVAVAVGFAGGALLSMPLLYLDPGYFIEWFGPFMAWQANITEQDFTVLQKLYRNVWGFAVVVLRDGGWLLVPLTVWTAVSWRRKGQPVGRRLAAASAWCLAALLSLAILVSRDVVRSNDAMPVRCFLAVAAAPFLWRPWRRLLDLRSLGFVLVAVTGCWWLAVCLQDSLALRRTDTRALAYAWCAEHIPADSIVLRELYVIGTGRDDIQEHRCRAICDPPVPELLKAQRCDFVITCSMAYERFSTRWLPYYDLEAARVYDWVAEHFDEVASFSDHPMDFSQPTIRVYRRREAAPLSGPE